jgi:hypothetical protein
MNGESPSRLEQGLRSLLRPDSADAAECSAALYSYAAGEATSEEASAFEAHLSTCEACRQDLATFEALGSSRSAASPRRRSLWPRWLLIGAPAAVAATLCIIIVARFLQTRPEPAAGGRLQIKGGFQLQVAVKRGAREFVATPGQELRAGDLLGLFYTAPARTFLVVLFADSEGAISIGYPATGQPQQLPAAEQAPLPDGAVVEGDSGCEWIVALFDRQRPDVERLTEALRQAITLRRSAGGPQHSATPCPTCGDRPPGLPQAINQRSPRLPDRCRLDLKIPAGQLDLLVFPKGRAKENP